MFKLACGDVMPGCAARFEANDHEVLLAQVAGHAGEVHGITDITPGIMQSIESKIVIAA